MKLVIDIPEILLDRIKSAKCVPDMYGSDIVNAVICVRDGTPYEERPHGEWISCSERLPEENICDDGYVEPSDYVLVFGDHGNYGVSRYWGNRKTKKDNPDSFSDWMDLNWNVQKPIAWMPLPESYKKEGEE